MLFVWYNVCKGVDTLKTKELRILPKENITKGNSHFYIARSVNKGGFQMHCHEFFELEIVISGSAQSNINGKEYDIAKNSVMFFTPADFHDIRPKDENEPVINYNIAFATDMIHSHVWSYIPMSCCIATVNDETFDCITRICERMREEYTKNTPASEQILKTGIEWILLMLAGISEPAGAPNQPQNDTGIAAVLAYIFDNFTGEVTRDKAAEIMHVSPMYFSKYFHQKMGMPFQEYILELRLDYAKRILTAVGTSVGDAALSAGFNSASYFTRVFTRKFGISPRKYAEQNGVITADE